LVKHGRPSSGEFSPTRKFKGHSGKLAKEVAAAAAGVLERQAQRRQQDQDSILIRHYESTAGQATTPKK
jgi:hypothetical protein